LETMAFTIMDALITITYKEHLEISQIYHRIVTTINNQKI